jgi:hypothetical protein
VSLRSRQACDALMLSAWPLLLLKLCVLGRQCEIAEGLSQACHCSCAAPSSCPVMPFACRFESSCPTPTRRLWWRTPAPCICVSPDGRRLACDHQTCNFRCPCLCPVMLRFSMIVSLSGLQMPSSPSAGSAPSICELSGCAILPADLCPCLPAQRPASAPTSSPSGRAHSARMSASA